jgi:hypothetical protein
MKTALLSGNIGAVGVVEAEVVAPRARCRAAGSSVPVRARSWAAVAVALAAVRARPIHSRNSPAAPRHWRYSCVRVERLRSRVVVGALVRSRSACLHSPVAVVVDVAAEVDSAAAPPRLLLLRATTSSR